LSRPHAAAATLASPSSGAAAPPTGAWAGTWKRSLVCRAAGVDTARLRDVNTVVVIEGGPDGRLAFSFGPAPGAVRLGLTLTLGGGAGAGGAGTAPWVPVAVSGGGLAPASGGVLSADGTALALTLLTGASAASVQYKMLDPDTVAVVVLELAAADGSPPVLQEGWMLRVKG